MLFVCTFRSCRGSEFLPELNEGSIWVNITLPISVSIEEARSQTQELRRNLSTFPETAIIVSKAGWPDDGTDPKILNMPLSVSAAIGFIALFG